ncbi:hypothetical protein D187_000024 [Cystobacter fuscus DSM 2262]|uniref:Uncharacterized protein n=1 Tax=Cystobacter fuscus (strain ATCC 25194 / DSM 2262 / NBRC 100088 / M29) TaxID=1242864 RepID=S9PQ73_CYSF2|nr:hypothetical protein D187_000024 [Cystobacter fuscus DSM 2262]
MKHEAPSPLHHPGPPWASALLPPGRFPPGRSFPDTLRVGISRMRHGR